VPNQIPTPENVDATFLTRMLRSAGFESVRVTGFAAERIGTGQLGRCFRFRLELAGDASGAPRSLVGKFPSDDAKSRETGVALGLYRKEVEFYRTLAPRLRIRTPRCYFAQVDGVGPDFALILEDMAPAIAGDQIKGCSAEVARAAALEVAGLHAPTWCDARLREIDWIAGSSGVSRALYEALLASFLARYGRELDADVIGILSRVAGASGPPFEYPEDPFSVVHIDYRLDNLLIDETRTPPSVTAVDWQSFVLGSPLSDVAYLLGASLLPEVRRPGNRRARRVGRRRGGRRPGGAERAAAAARARPVPLHGRDEAPAGARDARGGCARRVRSCSCRSRASCRHGRAT